MHEVTELLLSWRQGDAAALDRLIPVVYDELRRVARRSLRGESPARALQSTALVHEVYLRLMDVDRMTLKSRAHFFALAARLMRQILVDHARRNNSVGDVGLELHLKSQAQAIGAPLPEV